MDKKKIITFAIIVIVAIVAILTACYTLGVFNLEPHSDFDNKFMKGSFVGNGVLEQASDNASDWVKSYKDNGKGIEYNISTCDNSSFIVDYLSLQGLEGPETRNYNGQEWNIYHADALSGTGDNVTNATPLNVYVCQANTDGQSYLIYVISNGTVECDGSMFCPLVEKYIEPLLKSISLKRNEDVPNIADVLGMSQSDFDANNELIQQFKAGNYSALEN